MSRRKSEGALDELYDGLSTMLVNAPLWLGPTIAFGLFALFYWIGPFLVGFSGSEPMVKVLPGLLRVFAWAFGGVALAAWVRASITGFAQRRRMRSQTGLESIRDLSWRQFEELLATAYRQLGYTVIPRGGAQADGGVDIELRGPAGKVVVQCKRWKTWRVGAPVVRELLGVMQHEGAARGAIITCGDFTDPARRFAEGKSIDLIDGPTLARLIGSAQGSQLSPAVGAPVASAKPPSPQPARACPKCGADMVQRTARRGAHAGQSFWGCSRYPSCSGIQA